MYTTTHISAIVTQTEDEKYQIYKNQPSGFGDSLKDFLFSFKVNSGSMHSEKWE